MLLTVFVPIAFSCLPFAVTILEQGQVSSNKDATVFLALALSA
jgi:hypothetical protein